MATPTEKEKKACKILDKWFLDPEISDVFKSNHSKNTKLSLHCLLWDKSVSIEHQGKLDLQRHCRWKSHDNLLNAKRKHGPIKTHFLLQGSNIEKQASIAEVKVAGFLAEHNLPFATADHLDPLSKSIFPDSKIAKAYSCSKTKASCTLNRATAPDLQSILIDQMKTSCYSIATDGSNDQCLQKTNSVTVRLFDINQHKVVTKFYDMCSSTSSTDVGIFTAINTAMMKNSITWDNCVSLAVDNTSVNVGRNNSVIVESLMGCPCHIAHNAASKATKAFVKVADKILMLKSY